MVGSTCTIKSVILTKYRLHFYADINVSLQSRIRAPALGFTSLHIGAEMILKVGGTMNN